jgi:hypothetical protein
MDNRPIDPPVPLRPSRVRRGPGHFARDFLRFREQYDTAWEIAEATVTGAVFVLLFLGYKEQEHLVGLISHGLVGVLLLLKFSSLAAAWWASRHAPGIGLD